MTKCSLGNEMSETKVWYALDGGTEDTSPRAGNKAYAA